MDMNKELVIGVLFICGLASCTGDPTRGGIFWSPAKAQERQDDLIKTARTLKADADVENAKNKQLNQQLSSLKRQLAQAKADLSNATYTATPQEIKELEAEVDRLERELATRRAALILD